MSPRLPFQQYQNYQTAMHQGVSVPVNPSCPAPAPQGVRAGYPDHQPKNSVFANALSSPVRRSLQNSHLGQGGYYPNNIIPPANGGRNVENGFSHQHYRDSDDSSMDMHADSPVQEFRY